jgi:hypothetical protein
MGLYELKKAHLLTIENISQYVLIYFILYVIL